MSSPQASTLLRMSLDGRGSLDSSSAKIFEDPMVLQLLTENELMLSEIEALRRQVRLQEQTIRALRDKGVSIEADRIRESEAMLLQADDAAKELQQRDEKKVALLRPILESLVRLQFDMAYYKRRSEGCTTPSSSSGEALGAASSSGGRRPSTLADANAQFEQLYRLVASYQATPSFVSSPYDPLVLDALHHITALSKTLNAFVYADAEREQNIAEAEYVVVRASETTRSETPPPAAEQRTSDAVRRAY